MAYWPDMACKALSSDPWCIGLGLSCFVDPVWPAPLIQPKGPEEFDMPNTAYPTTSPGLLIMAS